MIGKRAAMASVCALALAAPLAGCTNNTVGKTRYVTVDRTVTPTPTRSAPAGSATSAAPPVSPIRTTPMHRLAGSCDSKLPVSRIEDALNGPVSGRTNFVVGLPDPSIGRVSYFYCQYGMPSARGGVAKVQIQISLYRTPKQAAARLAPTVADYTAHGAHAQKVTVAGLPATLLLGGSGAGYGPTSVLVAGQRTVAVTLRPGLVTPARLNHDLIALTALAGRVTSPR